MYYAWTPVVFSSSNILHLCHVALDYLYFLKFPPLLGLVLFLLLHLHLLSGIGAGIMQGQK